MIDVPPFSHDMAPSHPVQTNLVLEGLGLFVPLWLSANDGQDLDAVVRFWPSSISTLANLAASFYLRAPTWYQSSQLP